MSLIVRISSEPPDFGGLKRLTCSVSLNFPKSHIG